MVDKIMRNSDSSLTLIYTDKQPFTVSSDESALELIAWLTAQTVIRLSDWRKATDSASEVTQEIKAA